jgi:penicillin-binding protein 1A
VTDTKDKNDDIDEFLAQFDAMAKGYHKKDGSKESVISPQGRSAHAATPPSGRRPSAKSSSDVSASRASRRKSSGRSNLIRKITNGKTSAKIGPGKKTTKSTKPQSALGKNNKKGKLKKKHKVAKRIIASLFILILLGVSGGALYVHSIVKDIPPVDPKAINEILKLSSTMYDDEGNVIKNVYLGDGQRVMATYDQLPDNLKNAVIAIEDKTFETHNGFNFIRILGAIKNSIFGGGEIKGTSTITQQLARNIWLADTKSDHDINRKLREAYYAIQLEKKIGKNEILTDYLNTIPFGNHSYGVQAAAKSYFDKDVEDLDLLESAVLAALPQSPTALSPIVTKQKGTVADDDPLLIMKGTQFDYIYNSRGEQRVQQVLKNMLEQEKITQEEYDAIDVSDIRTRLVPTEPAGDPNASYFVDYAIDNVAKYLMKEYPEKATDMETARTMIYTRGLEIHTTLNKNMQKIAMKEVADPKNLPGVNIFSNGRDGNGNVYMPKSQKIMLYQLSNIIDNKGVFTFGKDEAKLNKDGTLTIYKGKRLNLYKTNVAGTAGNATEDISIEFKSMYTNEDGVIYIINSGYINVPQKYKTWDKDENCVISADFMVDFPEFFVIGDSISIPSSSYELGQKAMQPQAAFVLRENATGYVKAMVGGRGATGEMNYNRALAPHQLGSAMKPIGAYGPAIEMSANGESIVNGEPTWGSYWAPTSIIVDKKLTFNGVVWPYNFNKKNAGPMTMRYALGQSVNTVAVQVQNNVGAKRSSEFLKALGITTLVEEGATNDMQAASLALGALTNGVKPIEAATAYGTYANGGVRVDAIAFTEVLDREGNVILDGKADEVKAINPGTAFIMTDMLKYNVTNGIAGAANISGIPVGGKTGTTSENWEVWFCGITPKYAGAVWIGNDVSISMNGGSGIAVRLWKKIVAEATKGVKHGSFPTQPSNVVRATVSGISDLYIRGTVPENLAYGNEEVEICSDSGYLATPWCKNTESKKYNSLNGSGGDESSLPPEFYCWMHNINVGLYPISPEEKLDKDFDPNPPKPEPKPEPKPKPEPTPEPEPEPVPEPEPIPVPEPEPEPVPPVTPPVTPPEDPPVDPVTGAMVFWYWRYF